MLCEQELCPSCTCSGADLKDRQYSLKCTDPHLRFRMLWLVEKRKKAVPSAVDDLYKDHRHKANGTSDDTKDLDHLGDTKCVANVAKYS